jgi:flagellar hook assembly protein FlgD
VRNLHQGEIAAGMHQSYWDGTDSRGHYVSSGIYFYRLTAGDQRVTKRMTLVR